MILIHPTYFPSISHFIAIANTKSVTFEVEDNYQKQTYRNRAYVLGANGKLLMNVPVSFTQKNRQKCKDIRISYAEDWQSQQWKTLISAYRTSPFFEFYQDELKPLFEKKFEYLLDLNFKCMETVLDCLQLDIDSSITETYEKHVEHSEDLRFLVNARKEPNFKFDEYFQVFAEKHGFLSNLSILDLLFNEGPNALSYLKSQSLKF